ncbi:MAG: MFS transporter [Clostridia bacterium]
MANGNISNKIVGMARKVKTMWSKPLEGRSLNFKEAGSFGLYAFGNSLITCAISYVVAITYIPYFYEINAIHAYIIMILGNTLNMMLQPLLGNLMEKTNTKFGKYKPFILFSLPLLALFAVLATWIPQFEIEKSRIIYAYISCVPAITLSTFVSNMYQTMPNVITSNSQERADIMTPIGLLVGFGPSVLQLIAGPIRAYFKGKGMEYMGLRIIGIVSVVIGTLFVMFILKVKERVYILQKSTEKEERLGFLTAAKMLSKNKPLLILFLALALGSLREFWRIFMPFIVQFRYASTVDVALKISGLPLTIVGFASTVAMLLLPLVTRKMNKHHAIMIFSCLNLLVTGILGFVGFQNIPIGTPSAVILTILFFLAAITPTYLIIPLLLGDLCDYQQAKTGKRLEGYIQMFIFTIPALVSQIFMLGGWYLQQKIGFEPKDYIANNVLTDAQQAISNKWFNTVCIISAVSTLLMIVVLFFYPLSKKKHEKIAVQLKEIAINSADITIDKNEYNEAMEGAEDIINSEDNAIGNSAEDIMDNSAEDIMDSAEEVINSEEDTKKE